MILYAYFYLSEPIHKVQFNVRYPVDTFEPDSNFHSQLQLKTSSKLILFSKQKLSNQECSILPQADFSCLSLSKFNLTKAHKNDVGS